MTSGEGMRKVTLNLFSEDVIAMEKRYGYGWSQIVRELVRKHLKEKRNAQDEGSAD